MRISDGSSDVCSSDLLATGTRPSGGWTPIRPLSAAGRRVEPPPSEPSAAGSMAAATAAVLPALDDPGTSSVFHGLRGWLSRSVLNHGSRPTAWIVLPIMTAPALRRRSNRSEEHTSELQSLMRISYAVFCLKKK